MGQIHTAMGPLLNEVNKQKLQREAENKKKSEVGKIISLLILHKFSGTFERAMEDEQKEWMD